MTTVSNSRTQRQWIVTKGEERGYSGRLEALTEDANTFNTEKRFDRIVSIEMFEVNLETLMGRILLLYNLNSNVVYFSLECQKGIK